MYLKTLSNLRGTNEYIIIIIIIIIFIIIIIIIDETTGWQIYWSFQKRFSQHWSQKDPCFYLSVDTTKIKY